jgi:hypothetical protein
MNSLYPQQKKNRDSFKDNIDSDEEKDHYESLNSQENHVNGKEEELPDNSPYVMTIEIDKGISEKLQIFYDSVPEEVAYEFCKKHNLDYTALNYLIQEIKNVLSQNQTEERKEHEPILEEEEESAGSEGNNKKEVKIEDNNVSSYEMDTGENTSPVKITDSHINKTGDNIKNELTNNYVNQSTNLNEANHTEMNFNTTGQNTHEVQHLVMNTESTFKDSLNEIYKYTNSNSIMNSAKMKEKSKISKSNETNSFEQKLFSYQIFMDKPKLGKDNSNIHSNKKSMKNLSTNISVFDKLYHDSKQRRHQQMQVSHHHNAESNVSKDHLSTILGNKFNKHILNLLNKTNNSNHVNNNYTNVGENLYRKGINLKKDFEYKISFQRKQEMQKNKDLYTYKPNIMKRSEKLGSISSSEDVNVLTRFEYYKRNKDFEMKQLREQYEDKGNYSFVPKLNENSENIVRNKYLSMANEDETIKNSTMKVPKNFELYELSRLKPLKMKNLELQHYGEMNFMPNLNSSNKVYPNFTTRQEMYSKIKSENQIK